MSDAAYFDTPERSERLQLLIHLLNNAEKIPYLRAPLGAGKTRFARQAAARLEADYQLVWLLVGAALPLRDQLYYELGLEGGAPWPSAVLDGQGDKSLLLMVDDADGLQLAELADLLDLHRAGVKILLIGTGGLVNTQGEWDLQFIDLPPFSEAQTRDFIQAQGQLHPGAIDNEMAIRLHRAAGGLPGPLLDALGDLPAGSPPPRGGLRISWALLALGGLLIGLLVLALVFQDAINGWFEPGPQIEKAGASRPEPPAPPAPESAPEPAEAPVFKSRIAPVSKPPAGPRTAAPASAPATAAGSGQAPQTPVRSESAVGSTGDAESAVDDTPDPVLDAVIDSAIRAAEQPAPAAQQPSGAASVSGPSKSPAETLSPKPASKPKPKPAPKPEAAKKAPQAQAPAAPSAASGQVTKASPTVRTPPVTAARKPAAPRKPAVARAKPVSRPRPRPYSGPSGLAWLKTQAAGRYTLQLVGARDRASIDKFVKKHRIRPPYAVFSRELGGKPWYSLVAGSYPDHDSAVAARARRFKGLSGVWPRTFASIRGQMGDSAR